MDVLLVELLREGFAVGDLGFAHGAFDAEFGAHAVQRDLEVQLPHAPQDRLAGFAIGLEMQRGIGPDHLAERAVEFFLLRLVLRFHRNADHRLGKAHALEHHWIRGIAQRVARFGVGKRDERNDVAGAGLLHGIGLLGEHLDHAADFLALAARRILHRGALGEHARIDADEGERAVGVVDDLECERREGFVIRREPLTDRFTVGIDGLDRGHIGGSREQIDDGVEHLLHALVLVRRPAEHGREG